MVNEKDVLIFFRDELSTPVNWKFQRSPLEMDTLLQEYAELDELPWAINDYRDRFGVDISNMDMRYYFPWEYMPFFKRLFSRRGFRDAIIATRKPLTVRMFAESAKAGRWLYA